MSTIIVKCGCGPARVMVPSPAQAFQDRTYGIGNRVCNFNAKGEPTCTCCGQRHHRREDAPKPKKTGNGSNRAAKYTANPPIGGWLGGAPEKNGWSPKGGR